jgi:plastocyanin
MRVLPSLAAAAIMLNAIPAWAATITVTIDKLEFAPREIAAKEGDTIVWVNNDVLAHTATVKGKVGWEVMIPAKKSASRVMKGVGAMDYYCRFHPNMIGRITVTAP